MTCIVGLIHEGEVYIGGDSQGTAGHSMLLRADKKVFTSGGFVIGSTWSYRMAQLLQYKFSAPRYHESDDVYKYMVVDFIDAIRQCFKDGGFARKEKEEEVGGQFLVGFKGRLFCIDSDYQVGEAMDKYMAIGSGFDLALGAMHATEGQPPVQRIQTALEAAEKFNTTVQAPFFVMTTTGELEAGA